MASKKIANHPRRNRRVDVILQYQSLLSTNSTTQYEAYLHPNSESSDVPLNAYESIIGTCIMVFLIWLLFNNF